MPWTKDANIRGPAGSGSGGGVSKWSSSASYAAGDVVDYGGALWRALTTVAAVTTRVENSDTARITYDAGWSSYSFASASGGSYHAVSGSGPKASITAADAGSVTPIIVTDPAGGAGSILVNGVKVRDISFNAASTTWQVALAPVTVAAGDVVAIRNDSTGYGYLDAFDLTSNAPAPPDAPASWERVVTGVPDPDPYVVGSGLKRVVSSATQPATAGEGDLWVNEEAVGGGGGSTTRAISTYTTSQTLAPTDAGKILVMDSVNNLEVTLPDDTVAFPIGSYLDVYRANTGTITVKPADGVTMRHPSGRSIQDYGVARLYKIAANMWVVTGNLSGSAGSTKGGTGPAPMSWSSLFWAEGEKFGARALADGASVTAWDDEKAIRNLANTTGAKLPIYRAAHVGLNNKPVIAAEGTDKYLDGTGWTSLPQPFEIVVIARLLSTADNKYFFDDENQTNRVILNTATLKYSMMSGTIGHSSKAPDTVGHLIHMHFEGASSWMDIDGVRVFAGNVGANALTSMRFLNANNQWTGYTADAAVAMLGIWAGTMPTADKDNLLGWSRTHYATP